MDFWRKWGEAVTIEVPLIKAGSDDFAKAADWTPAAGDVTISKDGGAPVNITSLPTSLVMGNGATWKFAFTIAEMQCGRLTVAIVDAATKAVKDQQFNVITFGNAAAYIQPDLRAANLPSDVKAVNGDDVAGANLAKTTRAIVRATVAAGATATSIPTSACTPAGSSPDQFKGKIITFDADTPTTALRGQSTNITASTGVANPTFTVASLSAAPAAGDTFSIT